ncbi:MAG: hypothetical protein IJ086_01280 [Clostridium sp.]|nr:hypothetical protein [Clostridium sp.]
MPKNKKKHTKVSSTYKLDISSIEIGSHLDLDSISILGNDIKDIYNNIRLLYSKRITIKVDKHMFDFTDNIKSYLVLLDFFSYVIEAKSNSIKDGIKIAKENGKQIGKRKLSIDNLSSKFFENYDSYKEGNITKVDFAGICSCSRPTLDKWIKCYEENK